jgi:structural maintenance of chromosome 3 (chondroitin sulfate proteoglycan 6)
LTAEITTKGAALDELQQEQQQKTRDIMKAQKSSERYMTRRQTLMARQAEFENAIRDLGVLPEAAFSRYTGGHADKVGFEGIDFADLYSSSLN